MSLKVEHSNLEDFEKQINDPETTKKIAAAFEKGEKELIQLLKTQPVDADEIISKDQTLSSVLDLIMSSGSLEAAKEIFFENLILLMQCKEVCDFFKKEYIDENGKRYTIGRDGEKYYFTADLMKEILDDELTTTPAKQEETAWGVTEEKFSKKFEENNGFNVKEPKNNIEKVSDDFCEFMISASKGYSQTILDQRKEEVIGLLDNDRLLTSEIKEKILACTAVYEINEIYEITKNQSVQEESSISEQAKKHVDRYKRKLHDGSFDKEFNRAMKADLGPEKPVDLSKDGRAKACDEFGTAIENMDEILFGELSDNTSGTSRSRKK